MKSIEIRNQRIQAGSRIAVIAESSREDILKKAEELAKDPSVSAVEWRIDEYEDVFEIRFVIMPETIAAVRKALGDKILMYTFRDKRIGGAHPTTCMYHSRLNSLAINSGAGDIITVEWYDELDAAISNVENARAGQKLVCASWCTEEPFCAECVEKKLRSMLESKADILEYGALCPDEASAAALTEGIRAFKAKNPDVPVIGSVKGADGKEEKTVY